MSSACSMAPFYPLEKTIGEYIKKRNREINMTEFSTKIR
jgi:hypothetical protein